MLCVQIISHTYVCVCVLERHGQRKWQRGKNRVNPEPSILRYLSSSANRPAPISQEVISICLVTDKSLQLYGLYWIPLLPSGISAAFTINHFSKHSRYEEGSWQLSFCLHTIYIINALISLRFGNSGTPTFSVQYKDHSERFMYMYNAKQYLFHHLLTFFVLFYSKIGQKITERTFYFW